MPQVTRYGFLGPVDVAVVEACDVTAGGGIVLTSGVGAAPTFCNLADKILDRTEPPPSAGHSRACTISTSRPTRRIASRFPIYTPSRPHRLADHHRRPRRRSSASWKPTWRTKRAASARSRPLTEAIGNNVAEFLAAQLAAGMIPKQFLPIQSGVGDIANSVLGALGSHPGIPPFEMYTEVHAGFRGRPARAGARARSPAVARCTVTPPALKQRLRQPGVLPPARAAAAAGDQQQPRSHPPPGHHLHQHGDRSRYLRQRQQHPRHGPQADERHRRLGRFHAQRLSFDLHLPVDGQGRQDQHHRAAGQRTSITASIRCRSSPPNRASPTCAASRRSSAPTRSSTTARIPTTASCCTAT